VRFGDHTVERELTIGGGHASGELGWIHVGLGDAAGARIRVQWPDGSSGPWMDVAANTFVTIRRGDPHPQAWTPAEEDAR
jgi:enediyne biosynthesis protein E4